MIISHRHRFIFVRTEKTAGSSVEQALAELCGPEDVITGVAKYHAQCHRPRWTGWLPIRMRASSSRYCESVSGSINVA